MATTVQAYPAREITTTSFTDLTTKTVVSIGSASPGPVDSWDGENDMVVTFSEDLTQAEHDAIRRRMRTTPEEEALEIKAEQAIAAINTYLAITTPTNAQVVAQVKLLSRVCKNLIKMAVQDEAVDPTPDA